MNSFRIEFRFSPSLDTEVRNALLDAFLVEAIEANSLQFGGGGSAERWSGFVESAGPADCDITEAQRQLVEAWLKRSKLVLEHSVGDLFEAQAIDEQSLAKLDALVTATGRHASADELDRLKADLDS